MGSRLYLQGRGEGEGRDHWIYLVSGLPRKKRVWWMKEGGEKSSHSSPGTSASAIFARVLEKIEGSGISSRMGQSLQLPDLAFLTLGVKEVKDVSDPGVGNQAVPGLGGEELAVQGDPGVVPQREAEDLFW